MKQHFIFLLGGIHSKFTGIESAVYKRYKLFTQHLNIRPIYLGMNYDLDNPKHIKELKASGHIPEDFYHINVYEYFLRDVDTRRKLIPDTDRTSSTTTISHNGKKRLARVYNMETKLLSFVNFYDENGVRYRMDRYDEDGYLSISVLFTPDGSKRQAANYYRQDGSLAMAWYYVEKDGKNKITHIVVFDKAGTPIKSFTDEDSLSIYLLHYYLNSFSHQDQLNVFIDRHIRFRKHLVDGSIAAKVKCLHVLHSTHLEDAANKNSKLLSAYNYLDDLKNTDGTITLTPQQTDDIKQRFGDYGNLYCIPHSINHLPAEMPHSQRKTNRCIAVGRLHEEKRHDKMIRIFAKVVKEIPDAQLDIYGRGALEETLKKQIAELGLENNVHLRGFTDNIAKEFETAQCSLLTSKYEGQPLVVLESLSYGCPVISSDICYGPASMIENSKNGYLLPADDEDLFAKRIIRVLQERELAEKMSENAYQSAVRFSPENIALLWAKLVEKLTA